ncbi:MAG: universal stress protein [Bacteroidota bacterium]
MKTKLITLATVNYSKALMLKSRLEAYGIDSYLANVNLIQSDVATGVKLLVKDSQAEAALQIIHKFESENETKTPKRSSKIQNFSRIICPVDFSEDSLHATHFALLLAAKIRAEVTIIYAYNSIPVLANPFPDAFSYQIGMGNIFKDEMLTAKQGMLKLKEKINQFIHQQNLSPLKVTTKILNNDPSVAIPEFCRKYKTGLVVLGTKGLGKSKNNEAGRVALHTIENVNIPVLVIPKAFKFHTLDKFNIMYLTDFDDKDFNAFHKLMSIVSVFNSHLHCIHIEREKNPISKVMLHDLVAHLKQSYSDFKVDCTVVESKDVAKGINTYAHANKINLVSLSERKRNFLINLFSKSVVSDLLFKINTPLLVFKD